MFITQLETWTNQPDILSEIARKYCWHSTYCTTPTAV